MQDNLEDFGDEIDYSTRFITNIQFKSINELQAWTN